MISGTSTITFTYNGDGHRMSKGVDGVTTTYVVALLGLPHVLVETTGGSSTAYLYGHDLLGEEDTAWAWHLGDGLGSVRQLTDGSGDITLAQGYTPFGVLLWREGSEASGYGFTGEQEDSYVKLVFLRARYYDSEAGRFLTQDLAPGNDLAPQTLNAYNYVTNNAVNLTDPSGCVGEKPPPSGELCDGWSGIPKKLWCEPAERGSLEARENFYRWLAIGGRIKYGWKVAADLLKHHLDGSGTLVVLDSEWLLQGPEDRERRDELFSRFVEEHLKPAASEDCTTVFVNAFLPSEETVVPETDTDIGVAIGEHYIDGFFQAQIQSDRHTANVTAKYQVQDYHDFDPKKGLEINQAGVGYVPHRWIISLRDAGKAAEFDIYIIWTEESVAEW